MKTYPPSRSFKWLKRFAAVGVLGAMTAGGAFYLHCENRSEAFDLSTLAQMPDRVSLTETPQRYIDAVIGSDDDALVQRLVEAQFGITGESATEKVVRGLVASHIQEKFSSREILEFYLNRVSPGSAVLHRALAESKAQAPNEYQAVVNAPLPVMAAPQTPAEFAPIVETPEPQVRRAVAVETVPVARAIPVTTPDDRPVMRAHAVSLTEPGWSEVGEAGVGRPVGSTVRVSPEVIYRIAVTDLH